MSGRKVDKPTHNLFLILQFADRLAMISKAGPTAAYIDLRSE